MRSGADDPLNGLRWTALRGANPGAFRSNPDTAFDAIIPNAGKEPPGAGIVRPERCQLVLGQGVQVT